MEVRGRGVERSLLDPKVVGSNPGGAKIGLYDFHDPQNDWFSSPGSSLREWLS